MKNTLIGSLIAVALSGCSIGAGQSDFNCSGGDENALCGSSRSIYELTHGTLNPKNTVIVVEDGEKKSYTVDELKKLNAQQVSSGISEKNQSHAQYTNVPQEFSFDGEVLRNDVRVIRVWIAPFIDTNDDLHLSAMVYTDISNKSWELGRKQQNHNALKLSSTSIQGTKKQVSEVSKFRPPLKDQIKMKENFNVKKAEIQK